LVVKDKGLLAMDESTSNFDSRFAALGIPQTSQTRRAYLESIVTAPQLDIPTAVRFCATR